MDNLDKRLIRDYKSIIEGIRDFIELLKDEKVNPFKSEDNDGVVTYMNIDNEKDRIIFKLENNLVKINVCKEVISKNNI